MAEKTSALHATYVIDGVQEEYTPAQLLDAVTEPEGRHPYAGLSDARAVDETLDPPFPGPDFDPERVQDYLGCVLAARKRLPAAEAESYTRIRVASALVDAVWRTGRFRLGDLRLDAAWRWDEAPVGARAAFYASVRRQLKRAGTPIPQNDIWIAAQTLEHGAALCTRDADFKAVANLRLVPQG